MIISASRRTDIPAFYSEWVMNRLRAGTCYVVNPFRPSQLRRVALTAQEVDALVFWTRWSAPLHPFLGEMAALGHTSFFLYTVTAYGSMLEPHVPQVERQIEDLHRLAERVGADRIAWRYDPILLTERHPADDHLDRFARLAAELSPSCQRVIVSSFDPYRNALRRLLSIEKPQPRPIEDDALFELLRGLKRIAEQNGLVLTSCAQGRAWEEAEIVAGKCIDDKWIEKITGRRISGTKDPGQRPQCRCVRSVDIGRYNTCAHGCVYCYATQRPEQALNYLQKHDPSLEYL
ncbi:DUF1848 domain-containing protein [candidate division KSB1 bacterium]|nr:DUF1848 domain-containing protein [candidate division KSB1 bacterium]